VFATCGLSCGVVARGARFASDPWLGATVGFVGLMLLPALLAPTLLGVPRRELAALQLVPVRTLRISVPLVPSTFVFGVVPGYLRVRTGSLWPSSSIYSSTWRRSG